MIGYKKDECYKEFSLISVLKRRWAKVFWDSVPLVIAALLLGAALLFFFWLLVIDWWLNIHLSASGLRIYYLIGLLPIVIQRIIILDKPLKYITYMEKGERAEAYLDKIESGNVLGATFQEIFYYHYEWDGKMIYECYKFRYMSHDDCFLRKQGVTKYHGNYIVPQGTDVIIPIMIYNDSSIVIHNDCGFYDVAHFDGFMRSQMAAYTVYL